MRTVDFLLRQLSPLESATLAIGRVFWYSFRLAGPSWDDVRSKVHLLTLHLTLLSYEQKVFSLNAFPALQDVDLAFYDNNEYDNERSSEFGRNRMEEEVVSRLSGQSVPAHCNHSRPS